MNKPLVSIVIPCFNAATFVAEAINSSLTQSYPHREVIVVDDGSEDESVDVIRSFGSAVRCVTGPNRGAAVARNCGVEVARGEFIQFLDADDLLHPQKLERQVPIAAANSNRVVFCNAEVHRGMSGQKVATWGSSSSIVTDPVVYVLTRALQTAMPLHWKAHLLSIGGFRADMPPCEDPDLHLRLACCELDFFHIPESLVTLRRCSGTLSDTDPAQMRQLEIKMIKEAHVKLASTNRLTADRSRAIAGFLAKTARRCIHGGLYDLSQECFTMASRIHSGGGISDAYGWIARCLFHTVGPARTERLVQIKRRAFSA